MPRYHDCPLPKDDGPEIGFWSTVVTAAICSAVFGFALGVFFCQAYLNHK